MCKSKSKVMRSSPLPIALNSSLPYSARVTALFICTEWLGNTGLCKRRSPPRRWAPGRLEAKAEIRPDRRPPQGLLGCSSPAAAAGPGCVAWPASSAPFCPFHPHPQAAPQTQHHCDPILWAFNLVTSLRLIKRPDYRFCLLALSQPLVERTSSSPRHMLP